MPYLLSQTDDTQDALSQNPLYAARTERGDAAGGTNTTATMSVGDSFRGAIDFGGDEDWIAITLDEGHAYRITLTGAYGGGGTVPDNVLRVYNSAGNLVASNDDASYSDWSSALTLAPTSSGTYYLSSQAWGSSQTGTYTMRVAEVAPPQLASLDAMANYLTHGFWADAGHSRSSFNTSGSNSITVNLAGLTAAGQQLARWAFEVWETVANIDFVETGSYRADITFDDNGTGAYSTAASSGGTTTAATVNISTNWLSTYGTSIDSHSMATYIHEIGHAIGLGHQGNYDGVANYGTEAKFANDSLQLSIMSYFDSTENPTTNASSVERLSAMMVDIIAIQNLYGAPNNSGVSAGNTIWGANTNLGGYWGYLDDVLAGNTISGVYTGNNVGLTIYDQGGIDTLNLSTSTTNDTVSLIGGTFSSVGGVIGNIGIARGTLIENAVTGSGNDVVTGGNINNFITTNAGNDTIYGNGGNDTILADGGDDRVWGGDGNDLLFGKAGHDVVGGGDGFDTLWGGTGNDTVYGGGWADTIGGADGNDRLFGDNGDDLIWGGDGNDTIYGGLHDDTLNGGSHNDLIYGGDGNDSINGGWGWDDLDGGDGDDFIDGFMGNDVMRGGNGNDVMLGGTGDDTLFGGNGNDTLYSGWGNDQVTGGGGADLFVFGFSGGNDVYTDFNAREGDVLRLDDILWTGSHGHLSAGAVESTFGSTRNGTLTLTFDGGESLVLNGVTSLGDALHIF